MILSVALGITACPGIAPPPAQTRAATSQNKQRDNDPWTVGALPQMQSVRDSSADQETKFTHKEWTGGGLGSCRASKPGEGARGCL